jgi:diguanylate cyclase (GGDEF)-like protein
VVKLKPSRVNAFVAGVIGLFLLTLILATASLIRSGQETALSDSEAQAVRFVSGAEAALNRSLVGVDVLLASLDDLLNLSAGMADWIEPKSASKLMRGALQQNQLVSYIAIVNLQGRVLASSEPSGADLAITLPPGFVSEVLAQPVSSLMFSAPAVSFSSSELVLFLARYIRLADGSKVLAIAEVQVPLITAILIQGVDINGLEVTLERGNGQLLASAPALEKLSGKILSPALGNRYAAENVLRLPARINGAAALVVTRPILYRDVLISASIPLDAALREWHIQRRNILGVALTFALMILAAGIFAVWYLDRLIQMRLAMAQSKETLDQALGSMVTGFVLLNADYELVTWNQRFMELFPWLAGRVAPMVPFRRLLEGTAEHYLPGASEADRQAWVERRLERVLKAHDTHEMNFSGGQIIQITERHTPEGGVVIIYEDVTQLREAMAEVELLAFYDPLTGLANRRLLMDRMQQAMTASTRSGRRGSLLFLDLDHFKTINDTLGHEVGDSLLLQVTQRLKACVREGDTVARLGGDEFVVMLQGLSAHAVEAATQTKMVGENVLASLNHPYQLAEHSYTCTCSMGATFFDGAYQSATDLLTQADIAMYQVKTSGRNALCFFDPEMLTAINARADLEKGLRQALLADQFELYYQVQVAHDGHAVGAEALIRWHHPHRGLVSPAEFIGLAEDTGLIVPIGLWVLHTACKQLKRWENTPNRRELQLAVNVSARQFRQIDFVEQVRDVLYKAGANPARLKLELTETLVLDDVQDTIQKMKALRTMGVRFSMDDFGTGHSSLAYLTQLPLDQLKIDQSFVRNIGIQATDSVIIDTIIGMASNLGLEVIAEGVETTLQREFLEKHGCPLCQGYLFSKPLPLAEFEKLLN